MWSTSLKQGICIHPLQHHHPNESLHLCRNFSLADDFSQREHSWEAGKDKREAMCVYFPFLQTIIRKERPVCEGILAFTYKIRFKF